MAVPAGAADRPSVQRDHRVDDARRRVQAAQRRDRRADVGPAQEQTDDELREVVTRAAILLRQRHDHQGLLLLATYSPLVM